MNRLHGMIAATRFGLGLTPGELDHISADPRGWLKAQVEAEPSVPDAMRTLPHSSENVNDWWEAVRMSVSELVRRIRTDYRDLWRREAKARLVAAIASEQPFRERLVGFWSNHLTTSGRKAVAIGMVGGYEREAIRPHVTGKFHALLYAAVSHPAMLFYLDNYSSVGGNATSTYYGRRGINENLAREVLELHTLGVNGGYTLPDIRELAKILTGWTTGRYLDGRPGHFYFQDEFHEPGRKTLLGQPYDENGVEEGKAALTWLAAQPATARHVATKFARHFLQDQPPAPAVDKLATVFLQTEGDLKALALALIDLPEAWLPELRKLKTPQEYGVSAMRALGGDVDADELMAALRSFGHLPFMAPSPAGWPDDESAWLNPDTALRRARWSAQMAAHYGGNQTPMAMAQATIAPLAPPQTLKAIAGAASREEGLALLLASPTFQRR